jgi:MFS family permease
MAHSLDLMIAGRALQALGAGAMVPVTMAYVADRLPAERRPYALGLVAAIDTAGWVVGPLYGAIMVVFFQWRWIFFINLPFSLMVAVGLWRAMRETPATKTREVKAPVDWLGALAITVTLLALTFALTGTEQESGGSLFAGQTGFNPLAAPLSLLAFIAFVVFVWQERRSTQPLVPLGMFGIRGAAAACAANFLVGIALIAAMINVPLFVNLAVATNLSAAPLLSGLALAMFTVAMAGGSLMGGWLTAKAGFRLPAIAGLVTAFAGFVLMSRWDAAMSLETMSPGMACAGFGFGLVISPIAAVVINSVTEAQRGIASAIVLILRLVGMALGLAGLTTWGIYRLNVLTAALPPLNLSDPSQAARALFEQARQVSVHVLSELFLAAAMVCLLACLPAALMGDTLSTEKGRSVFGWR